MVLPSGRGRRRSSKISPSLFGRRLQFLILTPKPRLQSLPLTALIPESYPISLLPGRTAHSECGRMGGRPQTWRWPFPDVSLLTSLQRGIRWPQRQDCSCSHGQRRCEAKGHREDLLPSRKESNSWPHRQTRFARSLASD